MKGRSPTSWATPEQAAKKFREGLDIWDLLLKEHPQYKSDKFNEKDTGLIVKRYVRSLKQLGEPEPEEYPFKALLQAAEQDTSVDPFDANEMLGPAADARRRIG